MANAVHHVSVFVSDMDRSLNLFKDILGFKLVWRVLKAGGQKLSELLGIADMEADLAYLRSQPNGVGVELSHLIRPALDVPPVPFGSVGTVGLSLLVENLDDLHHRLAKGGWNPLAPCTPMVNPDGDPIRVFCIRVEGSLTLEFIELNGASDLKGQTVKSR